MSTYPINGQLLGSFKPSKRFSSKHGTRITSVDFDDTGEWCITAGDDETIQLYDCKRGKCVHIVAALTVDTPRHYILRNTVSILLDSHITRKISSMRLPRRMVEAGRFIADLDTLRYLSLHDNH